MNTTAPQFVAYYRVSTAQQGRSGLGLDAQRATVRGFVAGRGGTILTPEYVEVESGKHNDRVQLTAALKRCRLTGATLIVAKLDRLSRDAEFLMKLQKGAAQFIAADMPEANTMTVGIMALMAQHEREAISTRTKAALAAAKARGQKLGGKRIGSDISAHSPAGVAANQARAQASIEDRREALEPLAGLSLAEAARRLNAEGIRTARGCVWTPMAVKRARARLSAQG